MVQTGGTDRPMGEQATTADRAVQHGGQHGARDVREKSADVTGTAREAVGDVVHEATEQGRNLYERMRGQTADEAGAQVRRLADTIRQLADDLHQMGERATPDSSAASLVSQTADRGHDLAGYLDRHEPGELLDELREFARRRPGVFLAGAALAGFAASRVGKGVRAADGGEGLGATDDTSERPRPFERQSVTGQEPTGASETHVMTPGLGSMDPATPGAPGAPGTSGPPGSSAAPRTLAAPAAPQQPPRRPGSPGSGHRP